jgi:hypothetical protein
VVAALLGAACSFEPTADEVQEMEQALQAIPLDPGDGTIAETRFQTFLGVRRKIHDAEFAGRGAVEALRAANEGSNVPSMDQIKRVRRVTLRIQAARATALKEAGMGTKEYAHVMNALADIAWEPEMFRPDGLTPVQLANARLFQAHAREIRESTDMNNLRALRAKALAGQR